MYICIYIHVHVNIYIYISLRLIIIMHEHAHMHTHRLYYTRAHMHTTHATLNTTSQSFLRGKKTNRGPLTIMYN